MVTGNALQWPLLRPGNKVCCGCDRSCQAGVGPLFLTGLQRGPHASRPPLPFSEDTRAPRLLPLHAC